MSLSFGSDVGGTNTKLVAIRDGKIIDKTTFKTDSKNGFESTLNNVCTFCGKHGVKGGSKTASTATMGFSTPGVWGIIDGWPTVIGNAFNIPWMVGNQLIRWTKENLGIFCAGQNDAKLQIYGDCAFGPAKGYGCVIGYTFGTGAGGATIIDGKIFLGKKGYAGEFGHIQVDFSHESRPCNCGNKGCLEAYCATAGILKTAEEAISFHGLGDLNKVFSVKDIFTLAKHCPKDNKACVETVEQMAIYLGRGVAGLLASFNPDTIVFDGQISRDADLFWPLTEKWLKENLSQRYLLDGLKMFKADDPEYSGAIGAAAYAAALARGEKVIMEI
jgi:glucokinase